MISSLFWILRFLENEGFMVINKKGFTLAEVMLTVAVVGILAAVLTPAIVNVSPSSSKVMLKKSYAGLERAIDELSNDNLRYPDNQTGNTTDTLAKVSMGFNYTTIVTTDVFAMNMPTGVNKFCYLLGDKLDTVDTINATSCPTSGNGNFVTADGIAWTIVQGTSPLKNDDYSTKIIMDMNGTKTPNCTADVNATTYSLDLCGGGCPATAAAAITAIAANNASNCNPDIFIIGVRYDGKLQMGSGVDTDVAGTVTLKTPLNNIKN